MRAYFQLLDSSEIHLHIHLALWRTLFELGKRITVYQDHLAKSF